MFRYLLSRPRAGPGRGAERLARAVTAVALLALVAALVAAALWRSPSPGGDIELVARQPAAGGWSRDRIVVNQGERVRLRVRSEDVVHGFAIGRMGVDAGLVEPGKAVTVEFVADRVGEFTFYCTVWCDPNHPRMRGILEVRGPGGASAASPPPPDTAMEHLDGPRDAGAAPESKPSAARGLPLYEQRCASCHGGRGEGTPRGSGIGRREYLMERSPVEVFRMLAGVRAEGGAHRAGAHDPAPPREPAATAPAHSLHARDWTDQQRWDAVAGLWSFGTTSDRIDRGRRLYVTNCAACHGERGAGDGPGGRSQPKTPADFTDPRRMLAGTTALYTAKTRRGGMGTGMPYWGSIFTEEELAAVVDRVWDFSLGIAE
jgi:cytochrome c oxidase subunit 2